MEHCCATLVIVLFEKNALDDNMREQSDIAGSKLRVYDSNLVQCRIVGKLGSLVNCGMLSHAENVMFFACFLGPKICKEQYV